MGRLTDYFDYINQPVRPADLWMDDPNNVCHQPPEWRYRHLSITLWMEKRRQHLQAPRPPQRALGI